MSAADVTPDRWARYNEYLRSDAWRERRQLVLERAGGLCEGCRKRPACDVHHATYEHLYDELLFELLAVCRDCHKKIHPNRSFSFEDRN